MSYKAIPVVRGCKTRVRGGVYGECGMGAGGKPVEHFLIDPPHPIDNDEGKRLGVINPRGKVFSLGVKLIEHEGVWHVLDVIGSNHYPNVADFIEEARRFGVSRRFPKNLDFSKLTTESRMLLAHRRAWVDNFDEYANYWVKIDQIREWDGTPDQYNPCPKSLPDHTFEKHPDMCAGIYWQDVEQVVNVHDRVAERRMPSFTYTAATRPPHVDPQYRLAIFGSFPLHRLVVINDPKNNTHEDTLDRVLNNDQFNKTSVPVDLEDE